MKYIAQFRLQPGMKEQAVEHFESHGPNRNPGVTFLGAWIGKQSDVAFVLLEAASEASVRDASQVWSTFGSLELVPVHDVLQY